MEEPESLAAQRVKHLLRDLADAPFIALVMPTDDGPVKVYVKGVSADKMERIQTLVESILAEPVTSD